ncbi:lyase, partial [Nitrosopumilus sp. b1]
MMWGMDYSPDGSIWFTEEAYDSIWKFSILDEEYTRMTFPTSGDSLPQKLSVEGSQIVVNDFTGAKLTFLDPAQVGEEVEYYSLPSPIEGSLTGDFAIDSQNNIWYTNWIFQTGGILVKFDQDAYVENTPLNNSTSVYEFPPDLTTPNGIVVGPEGKIWIADTSS